MAGKSQQGPSATPEVSHEPFAVLENGLAVERWTLRSGDVQASVLTLGATLHTLSVPDRTGAVAQVLLSTDDLPSILGPARHYGTTVGRYANRIADSRITLDGVDHELAPTGPGVTLHGGPDGFANRLWEAAEFRAGDRAGVRLSLRSPDGDQGFPGTLDVDVTYSLDPAGELFVDYQAVTDRPTVLNLTNHAYLNLAGEGNGDVLGHLLTLEADAYTPVDDRQIPIGPYESVAGTPFDFTRPQTVGSRIHEDHPQLKAPGGYDHNWVLRPRSAEGVPTRAAFLEEPVSGRTLEVLTTEPGLQVYTANQFQGAVTGAAGVPYGPFAGIALETQHHPDSPHQPSYPTTVLRPGEQWRSTTVLRFGTN